MLNLQMFSCFFSYIISFIFIEVVKVSVINVLVLFCPDLLMSERLGFNCVWPKPQWILLLNHSLYWLQHFCATKNSQLSVLIFYLLYICQLLTYTLYSLSQASLSAPLIVNSVLFDCSINWDSSLSEMRDNNFLLQ